MTYYVFKILYYFYGLQLMGTQVVYVDYSTVQ